MTISKPALTILSLSFLAVVICAWEIFKPDELPVKMEPASPQPSVIGDRTETEPRQPEIQSTIRIKAGSINGPTRVPADERGAMITALRADFSSVSEVLSRLDSSVKRQEVLMLAMPDAVRLRGGAWVESIINSELKGQDRNSALRILAQSLVSADLALSASQVVSRMPFSNDRNMAIDSVAKKLIVENRAAAMDWLGTLIPETEQPVALRGYLKGLATDGDVRGLRYLFEATSDSQTRQGILASVEALKKQGVDTSDFASSSPDMSAREVALSKSLLISRDGAKPIQGYLEGVGQIADREIRNRTLSSIVSARCDTSPVDAASEVLGLPPEYQKMAVQALVTRWAALDADSTAQWIGGMKESNLRDSAIESFVRSLRSVDPASAEDAASSISDPNLRKRILSGINK